MLILLNKQKLMSNTKMESIVGVIKMYFIIIILQMTEQIYNPTDINKEEDNATTALRIQKKKMYQLQNKAYFFEGQINPLFLQNQKLKQQLIVQSRMVIVSTEMLRSLLPHDSDPNKKLKLEMANIQQISIMIKDDWNQMKKYIAQCQNLIKQKNEHIYQLSEDYKNVVNEYQNKIFSRNNQYEEQKQGLKSQITRLSTNIQQIKQKNQKQKIKMKEQFDLKLKRSEQLQKEFRIYKYETQHQLRDNQKAIYRFKTQIQSNIRDFQENKKNLKEIYQKVMDDKIKEINQNFQQYLKAKQEQKLQLSIEISNLQQECNKIITEKDNEINQINNKKIKLTEELEQCLNQIYNKKMLIEDQVKQLKQNEISMFKIQQDYKDFVAKSGKKVIQLQKIIQKINYQKNKVEIEFKQANKVSEEKIKSLIQVQHNLQEKIVRRDNQIIDFKQKTKRLQREHQDKIKNISQELQLKINQTNKLLQEEKINNQLKEKQIQAQKQKYEQQIKDNLEKMLKQIEKNNLINSHNRKKLMDQHNREMNEERKNNDIKMNNALNQQRLGIQHLLNQKEVQYKNKMQQLTKKIQENEAQHRIKLQSVYKIIQQKQIQNKKIVSEGKQKQRLMNERLFIVNSQLQKSILQIKKQQEKNEKIIKKYQNQLKQQVDSFQNKLGDTILSYSLSLQKLKTQMLSQINLLKSNNSIVELQTKYLKEIQQINKANSDNLKKAVTEKQTQIAKIIKQNQLTINIIKQQSMKKINQISEAWIKKYNDQQKEYQRNIETVAQKLEDDLTTLNEQLLGQVESHLITKMTTKEQVQYLSTKIKSIKDQVQFKQEKIINLEFQLEKKENEITKIMLEIQEKVKEQRKALEEQKKNVIKQYQKKAIEIKAQCQSKIKLIQFQRIKFSENLLLQFNQLRQSHNQAYQTLSRKYQQLEVIFEQRPSRVEDLTKIKQLIEQQNKMNNQIKQYQIKITKANQLVKYLNLQFQNYKDVYDIFGPVTKIQEIYNNNNNNSQKSGKLKFSEIKLQSQGSQAFIRSESNGKYKQLQSPNIKQFNLFPKVDRKNSISYQQNQQEQMSNGQIFDPRRIRKSMKIDKAIQFRNNVSHFLKSLSKPARTQDSPNINIYQKKNQGKHKKKNRRRIFVINGEIKITQNDQTILQRQ